MHFTVHKKVPPPQTVILEKSSNIFNLISLHHKSDYHMYYF